MEEIRVQAQEEEWAAQGERSGMWASSCLPSLTQLLLFSASWIQLHVVIFINRSGLTIRFSGTNILKEEIFLKEKS